MGRVRYVGGANETPNANVYPTTCVTLDGQIHTRAMGFCGAHVTRGSSPFWVAALGVSKGAYEGKGREGKG